MSAFSEIHQKLSPYGTVKQVAEHTIGLDNTDSYGLYRRNERIFYRPYRNYFCTHEQTPDYPRCEKLREIGLMERRESTREKGVYTYWMTRAGLDWIGKYLKMYIYDEED